MTVLYRGPRGLVTQDLIATIHIGWRRLRVADLHQIHIVRVRPAAAVQRHLAGISALVIAVSTIPLAGWPSVVAAGALGAAAGADLAVSRWRERRARWHLTATYGGHRILLFSSANQREFDQVCRALRRAVEHQSDRG